MKISRDWLQTFFDTPLPDTKAFGDALTFHVFEIEASEKFGHRMSEFEDEVLDVKVTPNRGHDCLSHRGIAKELSAVLNMSMKSDPLRNYGSATSIILKPKTAAVSVSLENSQLCARYVAGYIRGVKVGPSPEWLRISLEAVGQKSINNVVDATNFVMFNLGQPLHAFDAGKLTKRNEKYAISVRNAKAGERMLALDDKEYKLSSDNLVIVDANAETPIGIAGVKGGKPTGIDGKTMDIIIESANFDGVSVRRTARALKLSTDASERFQQLLSPELAAYGIRAAADLIVQLAGGEVVGFADAYPKPQEKREVNISLERVNGILGTKFTKSDIADVFKRLDLPFVGKESLFTVDIPFERLDLEIPEDLVEEVGRIIGYDKIPTTELPPFPKKPEINRNFYAAEHAREDFISKGYSEVYTSIFADTGERVVLNKVDSVKPYLRATLVDGLKDAFEKNNRNKDLLGLKEVKIFEIGTVWRDGKEVMMLGTAGPIGVHEEALPISGDTISRYGDLPLSTTERYQPFSKYPFIVRDISLWVPAGTAPEHVLETLARAGKLLVRSALFDSFEKGGRKSFAFRFVFQSFEKTLTDAEVSGIMEHVNSAVAKKGWEVR